MGYIITADDIRRFPELQGFEGEPATPEEMVVMGMTPPAEPAGPPLADPTKGGNPAYTDARNRGLGVAEAVMAQNPEVRAGADINYDPSVYTQDVSMPSAVSSMGGVGGASSSMLDLLSTPVPQDPMEGLSRNQRMLLGFAAMKDAGMALMGKDSNAVAGVMGDFTERADMERKRKAAVAQLEAERQQRRALAGLAGGDRDALIAAAMQGLIDGPTLNALLGNLDAKAKNTASLGDKAEAAANQLNTVQEILERVRDNPTMTTGPVAMVLRNIPISKAGQTQALVDSLRSTLALDTLKDLKATGATMGALNREELNILLDDVTKLDLALGAEAVERSLGKIDRRYTNVVRELYAGAAKEDLPMLDDMFGGRPSWVDGSGGGSSSTGGPASEETQEEFLERMRQEANPRKKK